jgi:hypothetical protein
MPRAAVRVGSIAVEEVDVPPLQCLQALHAGIGLHISHRIIRHAAGQAKAGVLRAAPRSIGPSARGLTDIRRLYVVIHPRRRRIYRLIVIADLVRGERKREDEVRLKPDTTYNMRSGCRFANATAGRSTSRGGKPDTTTVGRRRVCRILPAEAGSHICPALQQKGTEIESPASVSLCLCGSSE